MLFLTVIVLAIKNASGAYALLAWLPRQVCLPAGCLARRLCRLGRARCISGHVVNAHSPLIHDTRERFHGSLVALRKQMTMRG